MKKNLATFILAPRWGVGVALLALCAFAPVSRADVIVNNTASPVGNVFANVAQAQVFTMPGYSGNISSLTLVLNGGGSGSANVNLYNVSGGAPTGSATIIGTVNAASSGNVAVSLSGGPYTLSSGSSYAIGFQAAGAQWSYATTTGNTGDGSVGGLYFFNAGSWNLESGQYAQMILQTTPVPEVPITGAVMGFGALAIAMGRTLRRKLTSVSSFA